MENEEENTGQGRGPGQRAEKRGWEGGGREGVRHSDIKSTADYKPCVPDCEPRILSALRTHGRRGVWRAAALLGSGGEGGGGCGMW